MSFVTQARRDLQAFARRCGLVARDVEDIGTAVGEILIFALQPKAGAPKPFRIAARSHPDRIEIEIESESAGFGVRPTVRDPDLDTLAPRGLGMQIIRKLVTQITFSDGGTKARLLKRRSG